MLQVVHYVFHYNRATSSNLLDLEVTYIFKVNYIFVFMAKRRKHYKSSLCVQYHVWSMLPLASEIWANL